MTEVIEEKTDAVSESPNAPWRGWPGGLCAAGLGLEAAGVVWMLISGAWDAGMIIGAVLAVSGVLMLMAGLEGWAVRKQRSGAWALTAAVASIGVLIVALLERGERVEREETPAPSRTQFEGVLSVTMAVLLGLCLVWALIVLVGLGSRPMPDPADMPRNEAQAYHGVLRIAQAQKQYAALDWDDDGHKTYASFVVHLWQTVDSAADPVRTDFLPRDLAFAMEPGRAVNGYYFVDLHERWSRDEEGKAARTALDPATTWAVAALPAEYGVTGILSFIIDHTGRVIARDDPYVDAKDTFGREGEQDLWSPVRSVEDLPDLPRQPTD